MSRDANMLTVRPVNQRLSELNHVRRIKFIANHVTLVWHGPGTRAGYCYFRAEYTVYVNIDIWEVPPF